MGCGVSLVDIVMALGGGQQSEPMYVLTADNQ